MTLPSPKGKTTLVRNATSERRKEKDGGKSDFLRIETNAVRLLVIIGTFRVIMSHADGYLWSSNVNS